MKITPSKYQEAIFEEVNEEIEIINEEIEIMCEELERL
jgi:hypothetical protein